MKTTTNDDALRLYRAPGREGTRYAPKGVIDGVIWTL